MSSGRFAQVRTPLILSILMVLMTQVGYLDLMNNLPGDQDALDNTEPIAQSSPATSVVYGNNTIWATGNDAPIKGSEYIALGTDAILFQGTLSHTTKVGLSLIHISEPTRPY